MNSIDEAILFFLLSVRFGDRQSPESDYLRIGLIVRILESELKRPTSFPNDRGDRDFENRFIEFTNLLNEKITSLQSSHQIFDTNLQQQIFEFLDFPSNRFNPISLARAIQDLLKFRDSQKSEIQKQSFSVSEEHDEMALGFPESQLPDTQSSLDSDFSRRMISTIFSNPLRFAVDPVIGAVSFDELKKLYERDTGV